MVFRKNHIVRINLPGGIVSAGDLYAIAEATEKAKVTHIQFGTRQQLFCKVADRYSAELFHDLNAAGIFHEVNEDRFPNIVSSYVCEDVFEKSEWVSEGLYKDILDGFDFRPMLKINLVESKQSFVPFFTGNINFISSDIGNYWYLYVRFPRTSLIYQWKDLVYFRDIPRISRIIEEIILDNKELFVDQASVNGDRLYSEVKGREKFISQPVREPLILPASNLPYYEGFNSYGNKSWLGIYRREELFPISFLKDICLLCLQTKVGQLYATPWKSLIVKGIEKEDRCLWDFVLNKHRINVRHASNELNWQIEDLCEEGLRLKRWLVRLFDNDDLRTYGLCFAIKTRPKSGLSGSIIIRKQEGGTASQRKLLDRYAILYTPDFNANSKEYILFREGLEKENLYPYLASLCKYFYEQQMTQERIPSLFYRQGPGGPGGGRKNGAGADPGTSASPRVFQCCHCFTRYDEGYGDLENGVPPGRPFEMVRNDYNCPVCGGGKEGFAAIEKSHLNH